MRKSYFKGLIFSLLACAAPAAQAGLVSADDARSLAAEFFGAGIEERLSSPDALELIHTQTAGKTRFTMCLTPAMAKAISSCRPMTVLLPCWPTLSKAHTMRRLSPCHAVADEKLRE